MDLMIFFHSISRHGNAWSHKRVYRIYCLLKLNFHRKGKLRLPVRNPTPLTTPEALDQSWFIDFIHDSLAIEIDLNIPAQRVVHVLGRIVANHDYPLKLQMDNCPEFISLVLA
jgi:putative transposase